MKLDSSSTSYKELDNSDTSEIFQSIIDEPLDESNFIKNPFAISLTQDFLIQKAHQSQKSSEKSKISSDYQSDQSINEDQIEELNNQKKIYSKQFNSRLEQLLQKRRPQIQKEKTKKCNLDTSAALIKLMTKRRVLKLLFNIYCLLTIILRITYLILTFFYVFSYGNEKTFHYWALGGLAFARIMFCVTVYKLLSIGETTKDRQVKIIYQTYISLYDDINTKIRELEAKSNSIIKRTSVDEEQKYQYTKEIESLQKWVMCIKSYLIFLPPELSFFALRNQSNGFFQVQNFIVKSLETFFYLPTFYYFLLSIKQGDIIQVFDFTNNDVSNIFSIIIAFDFLLFVIVTFIIVYLGNRKYRVKNFI